MTNTYGQARGAFERVCRSTFKTLEKPDDGDLGHALGAVRLVELAAAEMRRAIVQRMRDEGASWADVGDLLGVSRQSAWERFAVDE